MKTEVRKAAIQGADTLKKVARKTIDANCRSFLGDEGALHREDMLTPLTGCKFSIALQFVVVEKYKQKALIK